MKFIRIRKHLASNGYTYPAFLVELDDNGTIRLYVSQDNTFEELTRSMLERPTVRQLMATKDLKNHNSVVDAHSLFYGASMVTEIDITLRNMSSCNHMFWGCTSLVKLKLKAPALSRITHFVHKCPALERLQITVPKDASMTISNIVAHCNASTKVRFI